MDHKGPHRTRERILALALKLFNEFGEPNVSTSMLADDLGISPGNLYYHFRNKDDIVNCLFETFEKSITALIATPDDRKADLDDAWQTLQAFFALTWRYRFLYRDMNDLLYRNRNLEVHFKTILDSKIEIARRLCKGLRKTGDMKIDEQDLPVVATNLALIATYWASFDYARDPRHAEQRLQQSINQGVYQVLFLLKPYIQGPTSARFNMLVERCVSQSQEEGGLNNSNSLIKPIFPEPAH